MTRFVEVEHPDINATGSVPESALDHWVKAGWTPVEHPEADTPPPPLPDGDPSLEWTRAELDDYAARRCAIDTTGQANKADVLAAIQSVLAAQPDSTTNTTDSDEES